MSSATATSPRTGPIEPDVLYPLDDAKRRLGWGNHAMRTARRQGLPVRYVGNRAYLSGRDVIDYINRVGKPTK